MIPPNILATCGEIKEESVFPIVIDKKTIVPEQNIIIKNAMIGTWIFRIPYVIPTPKPSKLTAMTKKKIGRI